MRFIELKCQNYFVTNHKYRQHDKFNNFSYLVTNPCFANPCKNSGVCQNTDTGYICSCVDGYRGSHCEGMRTIIKELLQIYKVFVSLACFVICIMTFLLNLSATVVLHNEDLSSQTIILQPTDIYVKICDL